MSADKKALIITAKKFEDSELLVPLYRLMEAGYDVDIAAPEKGSVKGKHDYEVQANMTFEEVADKGSCGYAVLIIPGGKAPEKVRKEEAALNIVRDNVSSGTPICAICHGPQVLITAGVVQGKKMTCYESVAEELKAAGADYSDEEVVVDGQFVTSRHPGDLPAFLREMMKKIS